jgi:hypothetical protein
MNVVKSSRNTLVPRSLPNRYGTDTASQHPATTFWFALATCLPLAAREWTESGTDWEGWR